MNTKKVFCVVAYDISDSRRRGKIIKVLKRFGTRVNLSVFECMFSPSQLKRVQDRISALINNKEDSVIYYPVCLDCFSKIVYQPKRNTSYKKVLVL